MAITFGKGRVFHTVLGQGPTAMAGLGFQVTLARGTEWAATGKVTLPLPKAEDLPVDNAALREPPAVPECPVVFDPQALCYNSLLE